LKTHLYELLEKVGTTKTAKLKSKYLMDNDSLGIRDFLKGSFDDSITFKWVTDKGDIPYIPNKTDDPESLLDKTKAFAFLYDGGKGVTLTEMAREQMLIDLLQSIHPKDAKLVIDMFNNNVKGTVKGLTKKLCNTTWEGLV
jgi:hypothetical protein